MKTYWFSVCVPAVAVAALGFDPPKPKLTAEEQAAGFVLLFNGVDLTGWREVQGKPGSFKVEQGILIGQRDREAGSAYWLSTVEQYADFELRLECMLEKGGNSGVFIRVPDYKGRTSQAGMEIQLQDDGAKTGKPNDGNTGAVYSAVAPTRFVARPAGEWNDVAIRCQASRIQVTINGQLVNDVDMNAYSKLKDRPRAGYIGVSAHTHHARFRNLRIRKL